MSKIKRILSSLLAFSSILASFPPSESRAEPRKLRVAVIEGSSNYQTDEQHIYGPISAEMAELGRFVLVERADLDKILQEHKINLSGLTTDPGKDLSGLEGVDYLCIYSVDNKTITSEWIKSKDGGYYSYTATINGSVKFVNVAKGTVSTAFRIVESNTENSSDDALNGTLNKVVSDIILNTREAFALDARMISRHFRHVKINQGSEKGIRSGYLFKAFKYGALERDPDTNEVLGQNKIDTGEIYVYKTYPRFSEGYILKGVYSVSPSDHLHEAPADKLYSFFLDLSGERFPTSGSNGFLYGSMGRVTAGTSYLFPETGLQTGLGLGLGGGSVTQTVSNLMLDGNVRLEYEIIPEFLSLYGISGLELGLLSEQLNHSVTLRNGQTENAASTFSLQLLAGLGLRMHVFGPFSIFGEAKYRIPTTYSNWIVTSTSQDSSTVYSYTPTASDLKDPTVGLGGLAFNIGTKLQF